MCFQHILQPGPLVAARRTFRLRQRTFLAGLQLLMLTGNGHQLFLEFALARGHLGSLFRAFPALDIQYLLGLLSRFARL